MIFKNHSSAHKAAWISLTYIFLNYKQPLTSSVLLILFYIAKWPLGGKHTPNPLRFGKYWNFSPRPIFLFLLSSHTDCHEVCSLIHFRAWCWSIIIVVSHNVDKTNVLVKMVGWLVKSSDWAMFKSVVKSVVYRRTFCQIYMYRPDGLQKILISRTVYDEQISRRPVWSPCQEILPVNDSVKLVRFSMNLNCSTGNPVKKSNREAASQRTEKGEGQNWGWKARQLQIVYACKDELVDTRLTWQLYKDWVFITFSWNIFLKWWFKWLWFKIRLLRIFKNSSKTIYPQSKCSFLRQLLPPTEVLCFWMLPQKANFSLTSLLCNNEAAESWSSLY